MNEEQTTPTNDVAGESGDAATRSPTDIDRVHADAWPLRDFPIADGRRENSVRVVFKQSVLNDIHQHGLGTSDVEICGVLIGRGYRDEHGPFIYIEANIRGQHSDSKAAQVTFTGETWNHIHNVLDRDFPELQILGWYHTHPGFGIFLSGMDLFIHENYFSAEHQLAFVYDPIGGDEGLFVWRNGRAVRDGFLIDADVAEDPAAVAAGPPSEPMTAGAMPQPEVAAAAADDVVRRLKRLEEMQAITACGVVAAMIAALVVPGLLWMFLIEPRLSPRRAPESPPRRDTSQRVDPVDAQRTEYSP